MGISGDAAQLVLFGCAMENDAIAFSRVEVENHGVAIRAPIKAVVATAQDKPIAILAAEEVVLLLRCLSPDAN